MFEGQKWMVPYILVVASSALDALLSVQVKKLSHFPSFWLVYLRSLVILLGNHFYLKEYKIEVYPLVTKRSTRFWNDLRTLLSFVCASSFFIGVKYIPVSTSNTLIMTQPLWGGIIGFLFFGESFTRRDTFVCVLSLLGVGLVMKPPIFGSQDTGEFFANLSSYILCLVIYPISWSLILQLGRKLRSSYNTFTLVHWYTFGTVIFTPIFFIAEPIVVPNLSEAIQIVLISLTSYFIFYWFTKACSMEESSKLMPFAYSQIIFAVIFDITLEGFVPDMWSLFGMAMITVGCLFLLQQHSDANSKKKEVKIADRSTSREHE